MSVGMMQGRLKMCQKQLHQVAVMCLALLFVPTAIPATKKMALVVSAGSKLSDISLADLTSLCKGARKAWPDGKGFSLVIKDPESPEMRSASQTLFGAAPSEVKSIIAKLNENRVVVYVVESDDQLLHTVESTPGAVGILDVYSINSSVKVLRIDGKLPFDVGYALRGTD
jgi:hypothetical protein